MTRKESTEKLLSVLLHAGALAKVSTREGMVAWARSRDLARVRHTIEDSGDTEALEVVLEFSRLPEREQKEAWKAAADLILRLPEQLPKLP